MNIPRPTLSYRMRAWREFQLALDPLASPKPLPTQHRKRKQDA